MTDMRRVSAETRIHQKQPSFCDSYRSSRSSTPTELKTYPTTDGQCPLSAIQPVASASVNGHHANANNNYCNHLHSLESNANMGSIISSVGGGGGTGSSSTTSSTATTATAAAIAHNGRYSNGSAAAMGCEVQFDEREIYYVSPTKRKGGNVASSYPYQQGNTSTPIRSSLRSCERLRSFSPTTAATVAPSYPAITPTSAYGSYGTRGNHEMGGSYSTGEPTTSSHLSDTAMQLLRSGSCGLTGSMLRGPSNSSSSNLAQQHATPAQRMNPPYHQQNSVTFSKPLANVTQTPRGSLRRSKGRSNQSLCSCDAGADTDINPDPTRPLYQYSLERRSKSHTYTCEQNAQILMRLERERQSSRKLSLAGDTTTKSDTVQMDDNDTSDLDDIPPVPPPPAMKRNSSLRSLRLLHFANTSNHSPVPSADNNNTGSFCAGNELDISSLLDDCTTSILKCANAVGSELMGAGGGVATETNVTATLATMAANAKPDVCHVGGNQETSFYNSRQQQQQQHRTHQLQDDDIFGPSSKKSDPSLCFLHYGPTNGLGAGLTSTSAMTTSGAEELSKSQLDLQSSCNLLGLGKYSTIAATNSHSYARQLSQYTSEQQQRQQPQRCRCLSQSQTLLGDATSRDYLHHGGGSVRGHSSKQQRDNHKQQQIFHMGDEQQDWLHGCGGMAPPAPQLSRSYSNLVDIDGQLVANGSRLPYHKFQSPANVFGSSSCSFGTAANLLNSSSFTTLNSSCSNSGLKDKYLQRHGDQQQQQQQQQKEQQLHSSVTSIMPWKHRQCPSRGSSSSGTNSFRFDVAKHWLAVSSILLIIGAASVAVPLALRVAASAPFEERLRVALQLLDQVPLIDGHNDLPWNIRKFLHNKLSDFNFDEDLRNVMPWARSNWSHTDLTRLKRGRISAQFWAAYVPCEAQHRDAVQLTLEQIDVIKRLTERYSPQLTTCTSSEDILEAHKNHQLCSLTGVEGGHSLGGSLAVLRTLYAIGVRYMTLTSTCHTPWADSSYADAPTYNVKHGGLTIFGKTIIREMNRLGMMVDLSHVSTGTMRDALDVSEAPVIFSHSSAYELCNSSRNVKDDMLRSLAKNGGLVMVNFYSKFLSCSENSTVNDAVAHINHIKRVAGIDHVGLGAGYDGINFTPKGLEDVSSYPTLFAELLGGGWSMDDLTKLAGGNFLRVMQQVEKIRDEKKQAGIKPYEDHPNFKADDPYNCTSS